MTRLFEISRRLLPGALAALAAGLSVPAAAAEAAPRPALWLLADADTRIYLFGTTHILPARLKWRSAALDRAIAEADELVLETADGKREEGELTAEEIAPMLRATPSPVLEARVGAAAREAPQADRRIRDSDRGDGRAARLGGGGDPDRRPDRALL